MKAPSFVFVGPSHVHSIPPSSLLKLPRLVRDFYRPNYPYVVVGRNAQRVRIDVHRPNRICYRRNYSRTKDVS